MFPRMLCVVERVQAGLIGGNAAAPQVASRKNNQEKSPWRELGPLRNPVEAQFLRPLYLGESIAPYRPLEPALCVIPWDARTNKLLDGTAAFNASYPNLGRWMREAEGLWNKSRRSEMTLIEQFDYFGKLSAQLPPAPLRVAYAASGTQVAATILRDPMAVTEHALYWTAARSEPEAHYLEAILNSETPRERIEHLQAKGQWGARHFDKLLFELPIPRFDPTQPVHVRLATAAERAEAVAADVQLPENLHFVKARGLIRKALDADGISKEINRLVAELLDGAE